MNTNEKLRSLADNFCEIIDEHLRSAVISSVPVGKEYTNILPEQELFFGEYDVGIVDSFVENFIMPNGKYRVTWDGIPYECEVIKQGDWTLCGNMYIANKGVSTKITPKNTGEPFVLIIHPTHIGMITLFDGELSEDSVITHTLKIDKVLVRKLDEEYLPELDEEYLPDSITHNKNVGTWEKIAETTLSADTQNLKVDVKGNVYDAICVCMCVPTADTSAHIELKVDGRSVGKITGALATKDGVKTLIRMDAERRYYWTSDYTVTQLSSLLEPKALMNTNIPYGIDERMFNFTFKNMIDKNCSSSIEVSASAPMPADTYIVITARRSND